MAKENSIILIGKIIDNPELSYSQEKDLFQLSFILDVRGKNQRIDFPEINIFGLKKEQAYNLKNNLNENKDSYIMVRGMIATRYKEITVKCPDCGEENKVSYLRTEISTIIPPLVLRGDYSKDSLTEYSNRASVLGTVCSTPIERQSANGMHTIALYQIAIDRRFRIKEQEDTKYDYPWIKSFDTFAERSLKHLKVGSQILLNGHIQTREKKRKTVCVNCNSKFEYEVKFAEIVMTSIEYLTNCVFAHQYAQNRSIEIAKPQSKIINFIKNKIMRKRKENEKISS